jgi:hypothetical protein
MAQVPVNDLTFEVHFGAGLCRNLAGLVPSNAAAFTNSFGHVEEQKWHGYPGRKVILQFANPMSYYIFMTELIDLRQLTEEESMVQQLP